MRGASLRGEASLDYFVILCEKCNEAEVVCEYLGTLPVDEPPWIR